MAFIATTLFSIDILKLYNIFIINQPTYRIYIILSLCFIFILICRIIFRIRMDFIYYPRDYGFVCTVEWMTRDFKEKHKRIRSKSLYIILCKLLHIFRKYTPFYYDTRMYIVIVKYEVIKWFLYRYGFKKFIKEIIAVKFDAIDIFLLSYYYKWLVFYDSSNMREEIRLDKERENALTISILKKLKKKYGIEENDKEDNNNQETKNILKSKEYKDLLENDKEFIEIQLTRKIYNEQIKVNSTLRMNIEKNTYYLQFSNFYLKLNHMFFHYSLVLFWLLTSTKASLLDLKIKLVEPFVKAHSKYLIHHAEYSDNVTLRRKIDYQNDSTYEMMGHAKTIKNINNWKITDPIWMYNNKIKYHYHFRLNGYSTNEWYIMRDNDVWDHFSGKGIYDKNNRGLQTVHSYISRTHWGSDINFTIPEVPIQPQLKAYLKGYRYLGYPERFFDYVIDMGYYFIDWIIYKGGFDRGMNIFEIDVSYQMPLVMNFNMLFLVLLLQFWGIITIILMSRRVQIVIKENSYYFFMMFLFSVFYYFHVFLPYFDHNFLIDAFLYIIKLPFVDLKFNITDAQFTYILVV